jgi:ABC-2 type transport system ATP-binding protein
MGPAIEAEGLSVSVRLPDLATWSLKEFVVHGLRRRISSHEIWPLRDVTVSIEPGELMGVIGRNGAGKTTLMRAVSGIIPPTEGRVRVRGRTTPVIGLGAGFHTDLTGRENIELLGATRASCAGGQRRSRSGPSSRTTSTCRCASTRRGCGRGSRSLW